jgi:hypothetical protein
MNRYKIQSVIVYKKFSSLIRQYYLDASIDLQGHLSIF